MLLHRLEIDNFKNIISARLDFSPKVNGLLGNNGMGKSNLLDAIYYMSFCKSFTGVNDSMLIRRGEDFTMVKAEYTRRGLPEDLLLGMTRNKRKSLKRKGKEYRKLSDHIGTFPLVMISPADIDMIRGGNEERRRLMDIVISQSDPRYLDELIRYARATEQRNRLLRDHAVDHNLYMAIELSMDRSARYITLAREKWVRELQPLFSDFYSSISGDSGETVTLAYESHLLETGGDLTALLDETRRHDEAVGYTSVGPHRDDISLTLDEMPMRRTGSQGQCKTFTIAIRLAQYEFLSRALDIKPLLLLDDIFDKLDASRVERIMSVVGRPLFGQIFITDTNRTNLDSIVRRTSGDYRLWEVVGGQFNHLQ